MYFSGPCYCKLVELVLTDGKSYEVMVNPVLVKQRCFIVLQSLSVGSC